jgi:hypothetical protein
MGQNDRKRLADEPSSSVEWASSPSRSRFAGDQFSTIRWHLRAALVACGAALVTLASSRHAGAAPAESTFSLRWNAPSACPDSSVVTAEISRLLGHAPGQSTDRPVSLQADVALTAAGTFAVHITVSAAEGSGERRIESGTCEQAAQATALVASLAIDPDAVAAHAESKALASDGTSPGAASDATSETKNGTADGAPKSARVQSSPGAGQHVRRAGERADASRQLPASGGQPLSTHLEVGGNVGSEVGILPKPTLRIGGSIGLSWRRVYLELAGGYALSQYAPAPERAGQGANIQLDTLLFRGCTAIVTGSLELAPCVALETGLFNATGVGISSPETGRHPWLAALAGPRLAWSPIPALVVALQLDGGVALVRPRFEIGGDNPGSTLVNHPGLGVGAATLGVLVRVP